MDGEFYKWFASNDFDGRYNQKSAKAGFNAGFQAGAAWQAGQPVQVSEEVLKNLRLQLDGLLAEYGGGMGFSPVLLQRQFKNVVDAVEQLDHLIAALRKGDGG